MSAPGYDEQLAAAEGLATAGRVDEAADRFTQLTALDPGRAEAYVGLARCFADARQPRPIPALLLRAAQAEPGFLPTYGLAHRVGLHFGMVGSMLQIVQMGAVARGDAREVFVWMARLQAAGGLISAVRGSLRELERQTGVPRARLIEEIAADADMTDAARQVLRRAANLATN